MNARQIIEAVLEKPRIVIKRGTGADSENIFTAYIQRKVAGRLQVDRYASPLEVFKVVVNEPYRRQGVGTALYRAAEAVYGPLVPSGVQSDDAFKFWNSYRPGSIPRSDWRHYAGDLVGQTVVDPRYGEGKIRDVNRSIVIVEKPGGTTYPTRDIKHLLPNEAFE